MILLKYFKSLLWTITLLLLFVKPMNARVVKIGVEDLCPYFCKTAPQNGYIIDLIKLFFSEQKIEAEFHFVPFGRLSFLLKAGQLDYVILPEYEIRFDPDLLSFGPSLGVSFIGIARPEGPNAEEAESLYSISDITSHRSTIPSRGHKYQNIKVHYELEQYGHNLLVISGEKISERQLTLLTLNRAELAIGDYNIFKYLIKKNDYKRKIHLTPTSLGGFNSFRMAGPINQEKKIVTVSENMWTFFKTLRRTKQLNVFLNSYELQDWEHYLP